MATATTINGWGKLTTNKGAPVTRRGEGEQRRCQEADHLMQMSIRWAARKVYPLIKTNLRAEIATHIIRRKAPKLADSTRDIVVTAVKTTLDLIERDQRLSRLPRGQPEAVSRPTGVVTRLIDDTALSTEAAQCENEEVAAMLHTNELLFWAVLP